MKWPIVPIMTFGRRCPRMFSRHGPPLVDVRRPRVLMLLHRPPWPLDRGDRIRSYQILRHLSRQADVSVAAVSDEPITDEQRRVLYRHTEQFTIRPLSPWWGRARMAAALLRGEALTPAYFYRGDLAEKIFRWHSQARFDMVLTFCTGMAAYSRHVFEALRRHGCDEPPPRHMIDLVDVDSAKWQAYAEASTGLRRRLYQYEAEHLRTVERGEHDRFDHLTVVHEEEAGVYRRSVGTHPGLMVLRHGVDTDCFASLPDAGSGERGLLFVGNLAYRPNVEGVTWFAQRVLPRLRERLSDGSRPVSLTIVGRRPDAAVRELATMPDVAVHADVPDVRPHLAKAAVVIAPLAIARGVQNKVMEAMAAGRAVVASPGAAGGLPVTDGRELLIADGVDAWVESLTGLLTDAARRAELGRAAAACARGKLAWSSCLAPLDAIMGSLRQAQVKAPPPPPPPAALPLPGSRPVAA
jgi:polysaccharide biosynthesis protein PslH